MTSIFRHNELKVPRRVCRLLLRVQATSARREWLKRMPSLRSKNSMAMCLR